MSLHVATKRIVPILLGAPLLRASDGGMHTLLAIDLCGSTWVVVFALAQEHGCVPAW
jgi:hypothetical protein